MSLWCCNEHGLYGGRLTCPTCGAPGTRVSAKLASLGEATTTSSASVVFTCAGCGKHFKAMPWGSLCSKCAEKNRSKSEPSETEVLEAITDEILIAPPRLVCPQLGVVGAALTHVPPSEITIRAWFEANEHLLPINAGETYRVSIEWEDETTNYDISVNWGPMFDVQRV